MYKKLQKCQDAIDEMDTSNLPEAVLISIKDDDDQPNNYPSIGISDIKSYMEKQDDSISDMNEIVGVKRSSYEIDQSIGQPGENQQVNASFSALNDSCNQPMFKSKLIEKVRSSRDTDERSPMQQKEMQMMNQSIFTEKQCSNQIKNIPVSNNKQEEKNFSNFQQSFYMTNNQQPILNKKCNQLVQKNKKQLHVIFRNTKYFLQIQNQSIQINQKSLQDLYNQLFKREIFAPLFNYQIYDRWDSIKDSTKYQSSFIPNMHLKVYLERYVSYLSHHCPKDIEEVLKTVNLIQQGNQRKKQYTSGQSYFYFDLSTLLQHIKHFISSSKTEILKQTLINKIISLNKMLTEGGRWNITHEQTLTISRMIDKTWDDLSKIELIFSFEQTQGYCCKKIENSRQLKFKQIWIKYKQRILEEKHKFMSQFDSVAI